MMKRLFLLIAVAATFGACYDSYVKDYDVQAVYFSYQTDVRTVVIGEGMRFSTGVNLAGVISNEQDRQVAFMVDPALAGPALLTSFKSHPFNYVKSLFDTVTYVSELSPDCYRLTTESGDNQVTVIRKGTHLGRIYIAVDSARFLADAGRVVPHHCIPLSITACPSTEVRLDKRSTVIGVRYENMLFGTYWHGGVTTVKDGSGAEIDRIVYPTQIPSADNTTWTLKTVAPFELTVNGVGGTLSGTRQQFKLTQGADGAIGVSSLASGDHAVTADGTSEYNMARLLQDRKIVLNYKWSDGGNTYHAQDTLTFRNRMRDGINEWQDENP